MKTKILFVIPTLGGGGAERVVSTLVRKLDPEKFASAVALFTPTGQYLSDMPKHTPIYDLHKVTRWDYPRAMFRLARAIREFEPDVVYSFMWQANALATLTCILMRLQTKLILGVRIFPSVHLQTKKFSRIHQFLVRVLYPHADLVLSNSRAASDDLADSFDIPRQRLDVIHNPLDVFRIQKLATESIEEDWFPRNKRTVLAVGRLDAQKGYPTLIRAFAQVRDTLPASLIILGTGGLSDELSTLGGQYGLGEDLILPGRAANPYKFMKQASLFVLSSEFEGFPNVLLEAMACGAPVVSTRCRSGPDEIIEHERNGLLCEVGDVEDLAKTMRAVLEDQALSTALGENAMIRAHDFDIANIVPQYEALFQRMASSGNEDRQGC